MSMPDPAGLQADWRKGRNRPEMTPPLGDGLRHVRIESLGIRSPSGTKIKRGQYTRKVYCPLSRSWGVFREKPSFRVFVQQFTERVETGRLNRRP